MEEGRPRWGGGDARRAGRAGVPPGIPAASRADRGARSDMGTRTRKPLGGMCACDAGDAMRAAHGRWMWDGDGMEMGGAMVRMGAEAGGLGNARLGCSTKRW
jgi:hypothetical protein